ncbi:hypothetical protein ACH5RR_035321 [Cinchona calisaya]|uniref:Uncharacterized protein n=1 Tax=Cinchona calisaya TaxID=153742 RepID=A0ABD2YHV9_9GENT
MTTDRPMNESDMLGKPMNGSDLLCQLTQNEVEENNRGMVVRLKKTMEKKVGGEIEENNGGEGGEIEVTNSNKEGML